MTDKQEKIDIYECSLYRQDMSFWCKYYPKGCNECGDLIKVGERILNDKEINMTIANQIIIDDQKKTIHRLQDECTEKSNAIIVLGEQLKRKEQECKKLRFPMKDTNYAILTKEEFEEYYQLKKESEELKKTILQKCPQCGEEYLTPKGAELYDENEKLKQALQEIKGIIFELMKADKSYKFDKYSSKILQKCEVINGPQCS